MINSIGMFIMKVLSKLFQINVSGEEYLLKYLHVCMYISIYLTSRVGSFHAPWNLGSGITLVLE